MKKVKIKVITIGQMPLYFDKQAITKWKSNLFEISGKIENYSLEAESDGENWEYSDDTMLMQVPNIFDGDFLIALTNIQLESNWYSRRLSDNVVVVTFFEIKEILRQSNIPIENYILRVLYAYFLVYKRRNDKIPILGETGNFTHDETKGCLFDMNGIKDEIVQSCEVPIVCDRCQENLKAERVSQESIEVTKKEIKKIRKSRYYRIADSVKEHPICAIIISSVAAIILGVIGSIIGAVIFELLRHVG